MAYIHWGYRTFGDGYLGQAVKWQASALDLQSTDCLILPIASLTVLSRSAVIA
jgi:hypothetical protein